MNRRADRTPRHRGSVSNEVESRRLKRLETESDHKRAGDRHRCAESRAAFNKSTETEGHEQELQTTIRRDRGDRLFHDLELPCLNRNVVEKHCCDHDPHNFEETE